MSIVYVGLDLGSSNFQQVALNHDGVSRVNRDFTTSLHCRSRKWTIRPKTKVARRSVVFRANRQQDRLDFQGDTSGLRLVICRARSRREIHNI